MKKLITSIIWPKTPGMYKVVQFMNANKPIVRFDSFDVGFHRDIVRCFAYEVEEKCIERKVKGEDRTLPYFSKKSSYEIVGMGKCLISSNKEALFSGDSMDYNIGINKKHLKLIMTLSVKCN